MTPAMAKHNQEPSEMRQDYDFMRELTRQKRGGQEPGRMEYAMAALRERGFKPVWNEDEKAVKFDYKGSTITFWPYRGWFSGKGVKDGRGIRKLLNQLR